MKKILMSLLVMAIMVSGVTFVPTKSDAVAPMCITIPLSVLLAVGASGVAGQDVADYCKAANSVINYLPNKMVQCCKSAATSVVNAVASSAPLYSPECIAYCQKQSDGKGGPYNVCLSTAAICKSSTAAQ